MYFIQSLQYQKEDFEKRLAECHKTYQVALLIKLR